MKKVLYIFILFLLASCQESDKERIARLLNEWNRKEIKFPDHSVFTIQGKDTVTMDYRNADFKVITYVDSIGCTSCKLQLHRWKELIAEMDSLTSGTVPFLFYFHPKDMKELRYLTRRDNFTYPVCFDEDDEFNSLNRFPSEMTFQTFLLNRDNRVVAMGNPVLNPHVRELYLSILAKEKTADVCSRTHVEVSATCHDFDSFPKSEEQQCQFELKNVGDEPLFIKDVAVTCDCIKVDYPREPISQGESAVLQITYHAGNNIQFYERIIVHANVENAPIEFIIEGIAE